MHWSAHVILTGEPYEVCQTGDRELLPFPGLFFTELLTISSPSHLSAHEAGFLLCSFPSCPFFTSQLKSDNLKNKCFPKETGVLRTVVLGACQDQKAINYRNALALPFSTCSFISLSYMASILVGIRMSSSCKISVCFLPNSKFK